MVYERYYSDLLDLNVDTMVNFPVHVGKFAIFWGLDRDMRPIAR